MWTRAAEGRHDNRQIIAMYSSASVQDAPDNVLVPLKIFEVPRLLLRPLKGPSTFLQGCGNTHGHSLELKIQHRPAVPCLHVLTSIMDLLLAPVWMLLLIFESKSKSKCMWSRTKPSLRSIWRMASAMEAMGCHGR